MSCIFTSPFVRCFETAAQVAQEFGLASVCAEPALSESFGEHFYRSWCVPYADGNWGGPQGCGIGTYVPLEKLKPASRRLAGELLPQERLLAATDLPAGLEALYTPFVHLSDLQFRWGRFETEEQLVARMRAFFDHVADSFAGQAVMLISHGGPLEALLTTLEPGVRATMPGYCGLYVLHRPDDGDGTWTAPVAADMDHMRPWTQPGRSALSSWQGNSLLGKDRSVRSRLPLFSGFGFGRGKGGSSGSAAASGAGRGAGGVPAAGAGGTKGSGWARTVLGQAKPMPGGRGGAVPFGLLHLNGRGRGRIQIVGRGSSRSG
uniref:Uncharacterized protein n=1 Tax=Alexandrium andersonii TaxID=327968 RepID=A0A7S2B7A6_9DINO